MPAKKKNQPHPTQTAGAYMVTGLLMWIAGYLLALLALDSGNLVQWVGVLIAFVWGTVRIIEGLIKLAKELVTTKNGKKTRRTK